MFVLLVSMWAIPVDRDLVMYGVNDMNEPLTKKEFAVAADGEVYLLHFDKRKIMHYAPSGERLGSFGGPGAEAGNLDHPHRIMVDDQHVYLHDLGRNALITYTRHGVFKRSLKVPGFSTLLRINAGWVYAQNLAQEEQGPIHVYLADEDLTEPQVLLTLNPSSKQRETSRKKPLIPVCNPIPDTLNLVVSADGNTLYARAPGSRIIKVFNMTSRKLNLEIELEDQAIPFDRAYGKRVFREANRSSALQAFEFQPHYPKYFPSVRSMAADGRGNLLIRRWTDQPDKKESYLLLDPMGRQRPLPAKAENLPRLMHLQDDQAFFAAYNDVENGYVVKVPLKDLDATLSAYRYGGERAPRHLVQLK